MADDIFLSASSNTPTGNDLSSWVGEGKKYPNAEEALKALPHSQSHIATLEEENQKLRGQVGTLEATVEEGKPKDRNEEILAEVRKLAVQNVPNVETPQLDEAALRTIVANQIEVTGVEATKVANRATAQATLLEMYGGDKDKATAALSAKAVELKTTVEFLTGLSETAPLVLLSHFISKDEGGNPKPNPTPIVNETGGDTEVIVPGTKRFYDKMRRDNPKLYHSADTLLERQANLTKMGADFYK